MRRAIGFYIAGGFLLLALAGCGRSFFSGERAAWRHAAEVDCLKSGTVKMGAGVVRMEPIEGPGMCGADFPLKVSVLGEDSPAIGYGDDLRPPGAIPNASAKMPGWPINEPRYDRPPPAAAPQIQLQPAPPASQPQMRRATGPPPARYETGEPMTLDPPAV